MLDHAQNLLTTIAPDLAGVHVTVPPPDYPPLALAAFATPAPDEQIIDHLTAAGKWQGPAPVIVVTAWHDLEDLLGLVLHEAAHLLPHVEAALLPPMRDERRAVAAWAAEQSIELPARCPKHGPDFVRRAIHLRERLAAIGHPIAWPALRCGWQYRNPPTVHAARALADEPARLADASFAEIAALPIPESFTRLWS